MCHVQIKPASMSHICGPLYCLVLKLIKNVPRFKPQLSYGYGHEVTRFLWWTMLNCFYYILLGLNTFSTSGLLCHLAAEWDSFLCYLDWFKLPEMTDNLKIYFNPTKLSSKHSYSTSGRTDNDRDDEFMPLSFGWLKTGMILII